VYNSHVMGTVHSWNRCPLVLSPPTVSLYITSQMTRHCLCPFKVYRLVVGKNICQINQPWEQVGNYTLCTV